MEEITFPSGYHIFEGFEVLDCFCFNRSVIFRVDRYNVKPPLRHEFLHQPEAVRVLCLWSSPLIQHTLIVSINQQKKPWL